MARGQYRRSYAAECSACGGIQKEAETSTFIDPFFLPDICRHCGEHMHFNPTGHDNVPHWVLVTKKERFVPAVRTLNPMTWFKWGRWESTEETRTKA